MDLLQRQKLTHLAPATAYSSITPSAFMALIAARVSANEFMDLLRFYAAFCHAMPTHLSPRRSGERIADVEEGEAPKVRVACIQGANAVLLQDRRQMRVGDQIAAHRE